MSNFAHLNRLKNGDRAAQEQALKRYCEGLGIELVHITVEQSVRKGSWRKRTLGSVVAQMHAGDLLVLPNTQPFTTFHDLLDFLADMAHRGLKLRIMDSDTVFDGSQHGDISAAAFNIVERLSHFGFSVRTSAMWQERRATGLPVGRPAGIRSPRASILAGREAEISRMANHGKPATVIAAKLNVHPETIRRYLRRRKKQD